MPIIASQPLPSDALLAQPLLAQHGQSGDYADCLTADLPMKVSLSEFVQAFYSSRAFQLERAALGMLLNKGASDADIVALAAGTLSEFAAWNVEARDNQQLLMGDFMGRTRSWLKAEDLPQQGTRLYFGTSVKKSTRSGLRGFWERASFQLLLPVHKIYARTLLRSAINGLNAQD